MRVEALPCFRHVNWRPAREELRRFAVSMLIGFMVLGLIVAWRGQTVGTGVLILWSVGVMLAVAALMPTLGRAAYLGVYLPSCLVGYVVSHVILALMFFLVFMPIGFALRLLGKDLLQLRPPGDRLQWRRLDGVRDPERYYRQF